MINVCNQISQLLKIQKSSLLNCYYKTNIKQMSKTTIHSFVPIQKLGEGTFSSVYKVRRVSDNKIYALKKVKESLFR